MSKHEKLCYKGEDGQWWDMSCNCDFISTIKNAERERIVSIAKRNICFDHLETKTCDHGGCYALDLLIEKINE